MLCTPVDSHYSILREMLNREEAPSKSRDTTRQSSVGVTDIQTPSVVRIADPAKDVSAK